MWNNRFALFSKGSFHVPFIDDIFTKKNCDCIRIALSFLIFLKHFESKRSSKKQKMKVGKWILLYGEW